MQTNNYARFLTMNRTNLNKTYSEYFLCKILVLMRDIFLLFSKRIMSVCIRKPATKMVSRRLVAVFQTFLSQTERLLNVWLPKRFLFVYMGLYTGAPKGATKSMANTSSVFYWNVCIRFEHEISRPRIYIFQGQNVKIGQTMTKKYTTSVHCMIFSTGCNQCDL